MEIKHSAERYYERLIGDRTTFTDANRSFNAISIITVIFLLGLLPFNIWFGLHEVSIVLAALIVMQGIMYWRGRFYKWHFKTTWFYAITSYLVLSFTYCVNSGIDGPAIFLFFLSFNLLIAFSPKKQHKIWVALHAIVGLSLLAVDYYYPTAIDVTYASRSDRFLDIASSYFVTLAIIFLVTSYLRNNLQKEKKLAEEKSEQLALVNRQKDKLFSIIAHDLRNPIGSLQSFLEMLTDDRLDDDEKKILSEELLQQTKKTSDMLQNLLSWTSSQMDGVVPRPTTLNLQQTLQHTIDLQAGIAYRKEIVLHTDINPDLHLMADSDMLTLVVRNLLSNAIKFTKPGGSIWVTTKEEKDACVLEIKDSGIGITPEKRDEIFSFNATSTYGTNNEKGTGLGLTICKEYIELQGGKMWFNSQPGTGTSFFISLPGCKNVVIA